MCSDLKKFAFFEIADNVSTTLYQRHAYRRAPAVFHT